MTKLTVTIEITMDNDAFSTPEGRKQEVLGMMNYVSREAAWAAEWEQGDYSGLSDSNGNNVGFAAIDVLEE